MTTRLTFGLNLNEQTETEFLQEQNLGSAESFLHQSSNPTSEDEYVLTVDEDRLNTDVSYKLNFTTLWKELNDFDAAGVLVGLDAGELEAKERLDKSVFAQPMQAGMAPLALLTLVSRIARQFTKKGRSDGQGSIYDGVLALTRDGKSLPFQIQLHLVLNTKGKLSVLDKTKVSFLTPEGTLIDSLQLSQFTTSINGETIQLNWDEGMRITIPYTVETNGKIVPGFAKSVVEISSNNLSILNPVLTGEPEVRVAGPTVEVTAELKSAVTPEGEDVFRAVISNHDDTQEIEVTMPENAAEPNAVKINLIRVTSLVMAGNGELEERPLQLRAQGSNIQILAADGDAVLAVLVADPKTPVGYSLKYDAVQWYEVIPAQIKHGGSGLALADDADPAVDSGWIQWDDGDVLACEPDTDEVLLSNTADVPSKVSDASDADRPRSNQDTRSPVPLVDVPAVDADSLPEAVTSRSNTSFIKPNGKAGFYIVNMILEDHRRVEFAVEDRAGDFLFVEGSEKIFVGDTLLTEPVSIQKTSGKTTDFKIHMSGETADLQIVRVEGNATRFEVKCDSSAIPLENHGLVVGKPKVLTAAVTEVYRNATVSIYLDDGRVLTVNLNRDQTNYKKVYQSKASLTGYSKSLKVTTPGIIGGDKMNVVVEGVDVHIQFEVQYQSKWQSSGTKGHYTAQSVVVKNTNLPNLLPATQIALEPITWDQTSPYRYQLPNGQILVLSPEGLDLPPDIMWRHLVENLTDAELAQYLDNFPNKENLKGKLVANDGTVRDVFFHKNPNTNFVEVLDANGDIVSLVNPQILPIPPASTASDDATIVEIGVISNEMEITNFCLLDDGAVTTIEEAGLLISSTPQGTDPVSFIAEVVLGEGEGKRTVSGTLHWIEEYQHWTFVSDDSSVKVEIKWGQSDNRIVVSELSDRVIVTKPSISVDRAPASPIPAVADVVPAVADVVPAVAEVVPAVAEVVPAVAEVVPAVAEVVPAVAEVVPAVAEVVPAVAEVVPAVAEVVPAVAEVVPASPEPAAIAPTMPAVPAVPSPLETVSTQSVTTYYDLDSLGLPPDKLVLEYEGYKLSYDLTRLKPPVILSRKTLGDRDKVDLKDSTGRIIRYSISVQRDGVSNNYKIVIVPQGQQDVSFVVEVAGPAVFRKNQAHYKLYGEGKNPTLPAPVTEPAPTSRVPAVATSAPEPVPVPATQAPTATSATPAPEATTEIAAPAIEVVGENSKFVEIDMPKGRLGGPYAGEIEFVYQVLPDGQIQFLPEKFKFDVAANGQPLSAEILADGRIRFETSTRETVVWTFDPKTQTARGSLTPVSGVEVVRTISKSAPTRRSASAPDAAVATQETAEQIPSVAPSELTTELKTYGIKFAKGKHVGGPFVYEGYNFSYDLPGFNSQKAWSQNGLLNSQYIQITDASGNPVHFTVRVTSNRRNWNNLVYQAEITPVGQNQVSFRILIKGGDVIASRLSLFSCIGVRRNSVPTVSGVPVVKAPAVVPVEPSLAVPPVAKVAAPAAPAPVAPAAPAPVASVAPAPVASVAPEPVASVAPEPVASVAPEPVAPVAITKGANLIDRAIQGVRSSLIESGVEVDEKAFKDAIEDFRAKEEVSPSRDLYAAKRRLRASYSAKLSNIRSVGTVRVEPNPAVIVTSPPVETQMTSNELIVWTARILMNSNESQVFKAALRKISVSLNKGEINEARALELRNYWHAWRQMFVDAPTDLAAQQWQEFAESRPQDVAFVNSVIDDIPVQLLRESSQRQIHIQFIIDLNAELTTSDFCRFFDAYPDFNIELALEAIDSEVLQDVDIVEAYRVVEKLYTHGYETPAARQSILEWAVSENASPAEISNRVDFAVSKKSFDVKIATEALHLSQAQELTLAEAYSFVNELHDFGLTDPTQRSELIKALSSEGEASLSRRAILTEILKTSFDADTKLLVLDFMRSLASDPSVIGENLIVLQELQSSAKATSGSKATGALGIMAFLDPATIHNVHDVMWRMLDGFSHHESLASILHGVGETPSIPKLAVITALFVSFGRDVQAPKFWQALQFTWPKVDFSKIPAEVKTFSLGMGIGLPTGALFALVTSYIIAVLEGETGIDFPTSVENTAQLPGIFSANYLSEIAVHRLMPAVVQKAPTFISSAEGFVRMGPGFVAGGEMAGEVLQGVGMDEIEHPFVTAAAHGSGAIAGGMSWNALLAFAARTGPYAAGLARAGTPIGIATIAIQYGLPLANDFYIAAEHTEGVNRARSNTFIQAVMMPKVQNNFGTLVQHNYNDVFNWVRDADMKAGQGGIPAMMMTRYGELAYVYASVEKKMRQAKLDHKVEFEQAYQEWLGSVLIPEILNMISEDSMFASHTDRVVFAVLFTLTFMDRLSPEVLQALQDAVEGVPNGQKIADEFLQFLTSDTCE